VVALELCSLTFLADDSSKENLVASALFGDGAAAAVVAGDETGASGWEILDTRSTFYPDSLDIMGWNVRSRGLQVVFNRRIPQIVSANARAELLEFLGAHGLELDDLSLFLLHPGGSKVLEAYRRAYATGPSGFRFSVAALREFGNMSSATVLFVLERALQEKALAPGHRALVSALGPGFCSESLLLKGR
jgi:alkylresorcinol/alkylpyrone synthase